jgi:ketosteroid isomerase-like protein
MEAINRGDVEAAVALYEPNATFVPEPSDAPLVGHAAIREAIRGYAALGHLQMTRETTALKSGNGDLAMTGGRWKGAGARPGTRGHPISGRAHLLVWAGRLRKRDGVGA